MGFITKNVSSDKWNKKWQEHIQRNKLVFLFEDEKLLEVYQSSKFKRVQFVQDKEENERFIVTLEKDGYISEIQKFISKTFWRVSTIKTNKKGRIVHMEEPLYNVLNTFEWEQFFEEIRNMDYKPQKSLHFL